MQPTQLDPQIVALTKAFRQVESGNDFNAKGKSGEFGAYQFTPDTWNAEAKKYLGASVPVQQATPEQQNEVMYKRLADLKGQGFNVGQIASIHNAGAGEPDAYTGKFSNGQPSIGTNKYGVQFDVPSYAKKIADTYQQLKQSTQGVDNPLGVPTAQASTGQPQQQGGGALFPASPTDTPVQAGLKALGNTPGDALGFAKGALQTANPLQTAGNIADIGSGFQDLSKQEGTGQALWNIIKGLPQAAYETVVPQGVRQLISGDIAGAQKTFTEHPFSTVAPVVLAGEGGAKLADNYLGGNAAAADSIVNKGGTFNVAPNGEVTNPGAYTGAFNKAVDTAAGAASVITKPIEAIAKAPLTVGRSILSHVTGLNPETINAVVSDPGAFSKLRQEAMNRSSVASDFASGVDEFIKQNEENGSEYQDIRANNTPIKVPVDWADKVLENHGFKIDIGNGKILADTNSITRNTTDVNALQKFYDDWGQKKIFTPNEFLNMRTDLADLANYDKMNSGIGKTKSSQVVANDLRVEANKIIRPKIQGLQALDERVAPRLEFYKKIKKDFLNGDGTFKDNAPSKIANALNKEQLLSRMEQVRPGITKSIKILKAVEDIQRANGIKVGNYARAVLEGGGILSGNVPAIVAAIITHPAIATQILRGFGIAGKAAIPIIGTLQILAGQVGPAVKVAGITQGNQSNSPQQ